MNQETKLRVQAYLDRETNERESREIAALVEQDTEARAVCAELQEIRAILRSNEPEHKVPESREFYWSKIERAIQPRTAVRSEQAFLRGPRWWARFFAPAVGAAFLFVAALSIVKLTHGPSELTYLHEIETPLPETTSMSFYSASEGMTVVWVQSRVY
jgi:negative regulator of sigma E activity